MSEQLLKAHVTWTDKYHFEGRAEHEQIVAIDYGPPLGDGNGLRPMELLLMSLASCSGQIVISLLQKMKQDVRGFTVRAEGDKQTEHPTVFTEIRLTYEVRGANLHAPSVEKAVRLSEEKYCPVWAMLKPGVKIAFLYKILPV
jgi:putative redox protein